MVVSAVLAAALGAQAAFGCSCAPPGSYDGRESFADAGAAIYGEVLERRASGETVTYRMRVIERFKGDVGAEVEVDTAANGGMCGLGLQVGDQRGLLLYQREGRWRGGLCGQRSLEELREAAQAPRPRSSGPIRMVVAGEFGAERVAALDARGRLVRVGLGEGDAARIAACPGGRRVLEGVHREGAGWSLAVRDVATMKVRSTLDLDLDPGRYTEAVFDLRCDSADGRLARIGVMGGEGGASVISVDGRAFARTWRAASGEMRLPRIALGRRYAWIVVNGQLLRVDPVSGAVRDLGARPGEMVLAVSPDERRLLTGTGYGGSHVHQIDARTGSVIRSLDAASAQLAHWIDGRSIALALEDGLRFSDDRGRVRATQRSGSHVAAVAAARVTVVNGRVMQTYDAKGGRSARPDGSSPPA